MRIPRTRALPGAPALLALLLLITAGIGGEVGAQVGYGTRTKKRVTPPADTVRTPPAEAPTPAPDSTGGAVPGPQPGVAGLPRGPRPSPPKVRRRAVDGVPRGGGEDRGPGGTAGQAAPETPETKGEGAPGTKPPGGPVPPAGVAQETKPPSYMFPEGDPPRAAYLAGPPRKQGLEPTPDGHGEFGLGMKAPSQDRKSDLTVLGGRPREALPSRFLLKPNTGQVQSEIELDLERHTITRSRRIENVVVEDQGLEDIGDHVTSRIYAGRFQDVAKESRTLIGTTIEDGVAFGQGSGMTFASPVGLGPAESILGKGASITVRGSERISISGTSRWDANPPPGETVRQSKFPQLDLRQDLDVSVDGKVGDKVTIDWTEKTNTDIPLSNRIAILYRGYDDEVVKEVDLGNTALSLPGTQFVSYNGQHQGLFGVKTLSQFGDIGLTVIASKQEGQTASNRFVGNAKSTSIQPVDLDYVQRRFFFLVDPVDPLLQGGTLRALDQLGGIPPPEIQVTTLNVWRDNNDLNTSGEVPGVAYLDPRVAGRGFDPDQLRGAGGERGLRSPHRSLRARRRPALERRRGLDPLPGTGHEIHHRGQRGARRHLHRPLHDPRPAGTCGRPVRQHRRQPGVAGPGEGALHRRERARCDR